MTEQSNVSIAICGASGNQGFSVLKKLNSYKNYNLVYLTRNENENENKKKISKLENQNNIEIRYCDYDRPLSIVEAGSARKFCKGVATVAPITPLTSSARHWMRSRLHSAPSQGCLNFWSYCAIRFLDLFPVHGKRVCELR